MAVGNNEGGQLNVFLFELVMITRVGVVDAVRTIAVHPLVVAPSSIRYTDNSRSTIQETAGGALLTIAGRAARQVAFQGTFGVESRFLGIFGGTGDLRFKRFWHEIVRLSDATNKDQVDAEKDLFRSPFLSLLLAPYNPDYCTFAVNFYDFWHDCKMQVQIQSFGFGKTARGGGASGLTSYTLQCKEVGPPVTGGLGSAIINALFEALTTWTAINTLIKSYTLGALAQGFSNLAGLVTSRLADSLNAVNAQIDGATALLNGGIQGPASSLVQAANGFSSRTGVTGRGPGFERGLLGDNSGPATQTASSRAANKAQLPPPTVGARGADRSSTSDRVRDPRNNDATVTTGLAAFLGDAAAVAAAGLEARDAMRLQRPARTLASPGGSIDWDLVDGEGTIPEVDDTDQQDELTTVVDAALFQRSAGAFYGLSRAEFAELLSSTGASGRAAASGSILHVVTDRDTIEAIQTLYGVGWDAILRANLLLPDEALIVGRRLQIPTTRSPGAPSQIIGLPVFGSHQGRSAWGRDLYLDFRVDSNGGLQIVEGEEVLQQGMDWILALYGDEVLTTMESVPPPVQLDYVVERFTAYFASDRRVSSVDSMDAVVVEGVVEVTSQLTAINGATIVTGAAA